MTLATKTCIPCKGGVPRLGRRQAEDLIDGVEAWELNDDATRISRTFKFPNFVEAQALATRTADRRHRQHLSRWRTIDAFNSFLPGRGRNRFLHGTIR